MLSDDNVVSYNVYCGYADIIKRIAISANSEILIKNWVDYEFNLITEDYLVSSENEILIKAYLMEVCRDHFKNKLLDVYYSIENRWILGIISKMDLSYDDSDAQFEKKIDAIDQELSDFSSLQRWIADILLELVVGNYFNNRVNIRYSDEPLRQFIINTKLLS